MSALLSWDLLNCPGAKIIYGVVIAGLDPAIHPLRKMVFVKIREEQMDAWIKSGHDVRICVFVRGHSFVISPHGILRELSHPAPRC